MKKLEVLARNISKSPKAPGYEDTPVKNDGGVIVTVGETTLHITADRDGVNIRTVNGVITIAPQAANTIIVRERSLL